MKLLIIAALNKLNKYTNNSARGVWFLTILLLSSLVVKVQAQSDTILMRINERTITLKEFAYLYEHNSIGSYDTPQKCAEELIDFLLLSEHARAQGLDTLPSFREQLKAYQDSCDLLALLPSSLLQQANHHYLM